MRSGKYHGLGVCWAVLCLLWGAPLAAAVELPREVEAAMQRYISLSEELLPVLEAAKDKKSADDAAPQLQGLLSLVYDSRREMNAIPALEPNVAEAVRAKYEKEMRTRWGKIYENVFRLQQAACYGSSAYFKQFNTLCLMLEK